MRPVLRLPPDLDPPPWVTQKSATPFSVDTISTGLLMFVSVNLRLSG